MATQALETQHCSHLVSITSLYKLYDDNKLLFEIRIMDIGHTVLSVSGHTTSNPFSSLYLRSSSQIKGLS